MNCKRPIVSVAAFLSSQNAWFPDNLTSASYRGLNKNIILHAIMVGQEKARNGASAWQGTL